MPAGSARDPEETHPGLGPGTRLEEVTVQTGRLQGNLPLQDGPGPGDRADARVRRDRAAGPVSPRPPGARVLTLRPGRRPRARMRPRPVRLSPSRPASGPGTRRNRGS